MVERMSRAAVLGSSFPSLQHPLAEPQGRDGCPGEQHSELPSRVAMEGFGASENIAQHDQEEPKQQTPSC